MQISALSIIAFAFTLWFGLYLTARNDTQRAMLFAGIGLISYALALAINFVMPATAMSSVWVHIPYMLPSLFWFGAVVYLVPDEPVRPVYERLLILIAGIILATIAASSFAPQAVRILVLAIPIIFFAGILMRLREVLKQDIPKPPLVIVMTAALFFALATGLLWLPVRWIASEWVVLAISVDLVLLGVAVGILDAFDEGTSFVRDAMRSLLAGTLAVTILGGQIIIVMAITEDTSTPMRALLLGVIASVLTTLAYSDRIQRYLDQLTLWQATGATETRHELRAVASGVARRRENTRVDYMPERDFTRLTRRALSHYGDLDKLAASPLTELSVLEEEIDDDHILARANALKGLLRDGIDQLKPSDDHAFVPSDEWRYYNVLYYPYIVGLKPYSQRFYRDDLKPSEQEALDWFRTYVPERTLYNWQNTAAGLVAQYLRERSTSAPAGTEKQAEQRGSLR